MSDEVAGERRDALVNRPRTLDARVQRVLAIGLVLAVGAAFLFWYYTRLASAQAVAPPRDAQALSADSVLPKLAVPVVAARAQPAAVDGEVADANADVEAGEGEADDGEQVEGTQVDATQPPVPDVPRVRATPSVSVTGTGATAVAAGGERPAPVLIRPSVESAAPIGASEIASPSRARGALAESLVPTVTEGVAATLGPAPSFWLPKGAFLDCTLETAIDSTLAGFATCVTAADTYGADGRVVLLPRGSKLIGEVGSAIRQGAARVAVLWIEARTPEGVLVPLASPGTDADGRAGVPGHVDTHFDERFGAAILLSLLDAGTQALAASQQQAGTVVVSPDGSRQVVAEILKDTIGIPPTVNVPRGARVQVLVARDLDFASVYALRARGG